MIRKLLNLRIPSVFGILLLLVGVGITSYLVDKGVIFQSRATSDKKPVNIAITNVTPTSFSVLYTTDQAYPGSITYGTAPNGTNVALDDRDQQNGQAAPSTIHHITVRNLTPETTYYFSILSGDSVYLNNDVPYTIKTPPELSEQTSSEQTMTGTVKFPEGEKPEALILVTSETMQPLSTIVQSDGTYTISLKNLRTNDFTDNLDLSQEQTLALLVLTATGDSKATLSSKYLSPVPLITFGQNYDFTLATTGEGTGEASPSADTTFPQITQDKNAPAVSISSPEDDEKFTDQQPVFTGTAIPGEEIEVVIRSTPMTATVQVGADGSWRYRPTTPLEPGEHTITIRTRDLSGTVREFTRSFTVFAQGSQFVEPSISPTRTPTPTIAIASPTPTLTPTAVPSPTTEVTTLPTDTPSPTLAVTVTNGPTRPPIAATGTSDVLFGGIGGVVVLITGFFLFFLTKGSSL